MESEVNVFLDLPSDVVEELLQYLNVSDVLRLECCCRKGREMSVYYWRLIRKLDLLPFLHENNVDVSNAYRFGLAVSGLLRRVGPFLESLGLSKFGPLEYGLRSGLEEAVISQCGRLRRLELNNRLLERDWLVRVAGATSRTLTALSLSQVYIRDTAAGLGDELLAELLVLWHNVEWLRLRDNKRLRMSCWRQLPRGLKYLDVQGCTQLYTGYLAHIFGGCPGLESVCLTYSPSFALLPTPLMANIKELYMDSAAALSLETSVTLAVGSLTNLSVLSLPAHLVSDWLFSLIRENLRSLEELYIEGNRPAPLVSGVSETFLDLSKSLGRLRKISLRVSSWAVLFLLVLENFRSLKEVDLSFTLKEQDLEPLWHVIRSDSLEKLVFKGLVRPSRGSKLQLAVAIRQRFQYNCPKLKYLIL